MTAHIVNKANYNERKIRSLLLVLLLLLYSIVLFKVIHGHVCFQFINKCGASKAT